LKIVAPDSATPVLAATRLQRGSLLHSSHNYDIKFKKSKDIDNADALSRLPLPYTAYNSVKKHVFYTADLDREAARDKTLASIKMVGFKDLEKISTFNLKRLDDTN
jgi:hypothetical protein